MTKKIIFRSDGNSTTGLGHLYRLFSLVEIVKDTFDFVFLTKETSTVSVIPKEYNIKTIPETVKNEEEPQWMSKNFSTGEHLIIADGYQFDANYQKQIKELGYSLIYIDDLAKEHMYADAVINHSPYILENHYKKEAYTRLALGTQYALLRPLFLNQAKLNKTIETINSAFVCFGGADPFNLTLNAVKALMLLPNINKIYVVLGGAYSHQEIFDLEIENSDKIKTYKNLSEVGLIQVMMQSSFAIVPSSTILYELCCVKMPVLSGFYVDNQELIYKGFLENNAIYKAGNMEHMGLENFKDKIVEILENKNYHKQIEAQKQLFDSYIKSRHLNLIKELC